MSAFVDNVKGALTDDWQTTAAILAKSGDPRNVCPHTRRTQVWILLDRMARDGTVEKRTMRGGRSGQFNEWRLKA